MSLYHIWSFPDSKIRHATDSSDASPSAGTADVARDAGRRHVDDVADSSRVARDDLGHDDPSPASGHQRLVTPGDADVGSVTTVTYGPRSG